MGSTNLERRAAGLARAGLDLDELYLEFDQLLRPAVGFEVGAWSTLDPATGLFTSCTMTGIDKDPEREARLFAEEFTDDEPASVQTLLADRAVVAILSEVTDGDLRRARRYRNLLEGFGVTDELRGIMWTAGTAWSSVSLYRASGTFTRAESEVLASISSWVADAVRLALLRAAAHQPGALDDPPGIVLAHPDGRVDALTEPAQRWLDLGGDKLVTAAVSTAAALRKRPEWEGTQMMVTLDDSLMLSLVASSLTARDGTVAVIVDRARKPEVGAMLMNAYGLTPRQREVLGLLLLGHSMVEIARELDISEHTANDHRKAVYSRMGVASRGQLAALLQSEHYTRLRDQDLTPSPYGGFLGT
ncbi:MAG: helix-turn-helix transcriptional regulator [Acidimicrobiales bacterium]|nr:helix-turn-helix transcriptional regulator [Acidimicrobiales bacterium]